MSGRKAIEEIVIADGRLTLADLFGAYESGNLWHAKASAVIIFRKGGARGSGARYAGEWPDPTVSGG